MKPSPRGASAPSRILARGSSRGWVVHEDVLERNLEGMRDAERDLEPGRLLVGFDRDQGLAAHADRVGELAATYEEEVPLDEILREGRAVISMPTKLAR